MRKRIYYYLIAFLIPFSFFNLTGCDLFGIATTSSDPAQIEFISPGNGMVFPFGTDSVTIYGKIIPGTNPVKSLKVKNGGTSETISYDADSYEFQYEFTLDPSKHYSICSFEVCDTKLITNMERISFAVGDSYAIDDPGVGDNALAISMTEGLINNLVEIVEGEINKMLPDIVDSILPIKQNISEDAKILGTLVIDPNYKPEFLQNDSYIGKLELGDIDIEAIDCLEGDRIMVGFSISSFYVQGFHQSHPTGLIKTNFKVTSNKAGVSGVILSLKINEDDKVTATIDMSSIDITLEDPKVTYGLITIPSWLIRGVIEIVQPILKKIDIFDLPIMDANALTFEIANMNIGLWPMDDDHFFTTTEDALTMELGISMMVDDFYNAALYPDADRFLITEGEMPEIQADPDENDLVMAVSDELINQAAFTLVQSGLLKDIDLSAAGGAAAGTDIYAEISPLRINLSNLAMLIPAGNSDITLKASVTTPPVCDFSGDGIIYGGTEPLGTFIIPNLVIEIGNIKLTPASGPLTIRLSIDITAALGVSAEGNTLIGSAVLDLSDFDVNVLYFSEPGVASLMNPLIDMGIYIAQIIANNMISMVVELEMPENEEFTMPDIDFAGNTFENEYLVVRVNIAF